MEFTGNRFALLEMSKKVMKLANKNSPMEALKGIYLESDEDTGEVAMLATNYEAAIIMKEKVSVKRSGKLVIPAGLLTDILTVLPGDTVLFSAVNNNVIHIAAGACVYRIPYLSGEHYPKPIMPIPEETIKLSGICSLAKKTVFATSKDTKNPVLQCVNLKVKQNSIHAAACDGFRMMLVKGEKENAGSNDFLLPSHPFQLLASIVADEDEFAVGIVNHEVVFSKKNMLFTIKQLGGKFIDTNQIIQSIKPTCSAIANAEKVRDALILASTADGLEPVNIVFADNALHIKCRGELCISQTQVQAKITGVMPKSGFYYKLDYLLKLFQVLTGTVKLDMDEKGMLLIKSKNEIYFQIPVKPSAKEKKKAADKASA